MREDNHIPVKPEEVIVTAGGSQALFSIFYILLNPGEEIIIPDPGFLIYDSQVTLVGGNPVHLPIREENAFQIDPDDLRRLITPKTKAIIINSPSNPTGIVIKEEILREVAKIAIEHKLWIISDELYEDILFDGRKEYQYSLISGNEGKDYFYLWFSKSYAMTGWRLAYLTCPEVLVDDIIKVQQNTAVCLTRLHKGCPVWIAK